MHAQDLKIIVGLGNPGRRYCESRHNAGWMALDLVAEHTGKGSERYSCDGVMLRGKETLLFKPLQYMNRSGPPVADLLERTGAGLDRLLVLMDDLNLPLGRVRLRGSGSSGGHNGLQSVIEALDTEQFPRLRMGIGPCPPAVEGRDFVLSPFAEEEWEQVEAMFETAAEAALCWASHGLEVAMSRFNSREGNQPGS